MQSTANASAIGSNAAGQTAQGSAKRVPRWTSEEEVRSLCTLHVHVNPLARVCLRRHVWEGSCKKRRPHATPYWHTADILTAWQPPSACSHTAGILGSIRGRTATRLETEHGTERTPSSIARHFWRAMIVPWNTPQLRHAACVTACVTQRQQQPCAQRKHEARAAHEGRGVQACPLVHPLKAFSALGLLGRLRHVRGVRPPPTHLEAMFACEECNWWACERCTRSSASAICLFIIVARARFWVREALRGGGSIFRLRTTSVTCAV
jgi:hypothetical protein